MASKNKPDDEAAKAPKEQVEEQQPAQEEPLTPDAETSEPPAAEAQPQAPAEEAPAPQDAPPSPADAPAPEPSAEEAPAPQEAAPAPADAPAPEPIAAAQAAPEPEAAAPEPAAEGGEPAEGEGAEEPGEPAPRAKPAVPGAHLEVDIVPEGVDPLGRGEEEYEDRYALEEEYLAPPEAEEREQEREEILSQPIASAAIDLAAGARYRATGKRKTAIARVTLQPGSGTYVVNGHSLEAHFPRLTLQRNIRQPLEMVGYQERMDVLALIHGGGISAQAGALRHGVSRALLEADPNLRGELKRRGFLTRDSRAKERKKAGLKKARKRPQFSKR
jgi:small subunit ribosomal protein S9